MFICIAECGEPDRRVKVRHVVLRLAGRQIVTSGTDWPVDVLEHVGAAIGSGTIDGAFTGHSGRVFAYWRIPPGSVDYPFRRGQ